MQQSEYQSSSNRLFYSFDFPEEALGILTPFFSPRPTLKITFISKCTISSFYSIFFSYD